MDIKTPARLCVATAVLATGTLLGGCATIVHGGNRSVGVGSDPSGAKVTVTKPNGEVVLMNNTPCTISLEPKRGYFKGQSYALKLELPGYKTAEVSLTPTLSGWYFGNILIGGLIGMVIVDPLTGSMWNIEPRAIQQKLSATQAELIKSGQGFVVVLVSDLTEPERHSMRRIN
jgi:hypothetical protein